MIAIEPQTCIPNAFNNGTGLITLKEGKQAKHFFSVLIQAV
jgi:galactose mutarotase-like enzyme